MQKKWLIVGVTVLISGLLLAWFFIESSKPLLGAKVEDEGREHVTIGTQVEYKTNPPTSGKHYADWIRAGIYIEPKDDGNLVHSLEHGYAILSYNCDRKLPTTSYLLPTVYAHGIEEEEASPSAQEGSPSVSLSENFRSDDCHKLVDQLISVYEKKGKKKLIVIPRPNMDSRIALTAWTYSDKFDEFDVSRIEKFIDTHRNQGPEKTTE